MALDENGEEIPAEEIPFEGRLLQGFLEGSNVNAIDEMVEMITLLRNSKLDKGPLGHKMRC